MVDHYRILRVPRKASAAEIKSAYRRLARQQHPDLNGGSERAAREFALIALAYRTLSDPLERARYDAQREHLRQSSVSSSSSSHRSSVLHSTNPHAKRMRIVATQARWDRAVDRWIEAERRETYARTQAVFTTVTLFLSTFIVAMLKPRFWDSFDVVGRGVLLTLFLIGVWHLASRLRKSFARYTYRPRQFKNSFAPEEKSDKPFTRAAASAFLVIGYIVSLTAGLFAGDRVYYVVSDMAFFFGQQLRPDLLFYPPIAVLIVDTMHTVASKIDS